MSIEPKKQESTEELVARITKSIMSEALPALAVAMNQNKPAPAPVDNGRGRDFGPVCTVCRQSLKACGDDHTLMSVYTNRYPEFGEFFQGIFLNGVKYLSNDESHQIAVPTNAVTHIKESIRTFEDNERETRQGRVRRHNSGNLGAPVQAQVGWR